MIKTGNIADSFCPHQEPSPASSQPDLYSWPSYLPEDFYEDSPPPPPRPAARELGDTPMPVERGDKNSPISPSNSCPFCVLLPDRKILFENDTWFSIWDGYPVSPGHALVIPKRHITSFFDSPLTENEWLDMRQTLHVTESFIWTKFGSRQYNVGFNDGPLAGQTVPHLHIHIIPRYPGDIADPRGGIRWVMPDKANYWDGDAD